MKYEEAVNYIFGLRKFGSEPGSVRAGRALGLLGNPEKALKIIHVAGTNGKGSVCSYITNALTGQGFHVGMFTSPHLVKVNERIRLDGVHISDDEFLEYFEKVYEVSERMERDGLSGLAFFDYVFVMSMLYFRDRMPDYVVLETGMGGRTDATAAIKDKLISVITSISLDHTEILGDTLARIAEEKAGIIAENTPVVYWKEDDEISEIIEKTAQKCNSKCYFVDRNSFEILKMERKHIDFSFHNGYYENSMFSIQNTGLYQVMNAVIALQVLSVLDSQQVWNTERIRKDIEETVWEGRMEEIENNIYLDGAHNPDGIQKFLETAAALKGSGRMYLLFGAVCEKDYEQMIQEICSAGCFDGYVITRIHNHRALNCDIMKNEFNKYTDKPVYVRCDNRDAYTFARALLGENDILLCAGSLYLVGAIKELIGE